MKIVKSRLDIQVYVNCPHCDYLIDLLDENDTDGVAHNDCGDILKEAFPSGNWSESHDKFYLEYVTCTDCKGSFRVSGMEW